MLNEKQSNTSMAMVVDKDNLKQTKTKGYSLQNKKKKTVNTYLKRLTHTTHE